MVAYLKSDLEFILAQIKIAEAHADATTGATSIEESRQILLDLLPNSTIPWGLRTVDGSLNNLVPGQEYFGAAGQPFPQMLDPSYRTIFVPFDPDNNPATPNSFLAPVSYAPGADNDGSGPAGPGDVFDPFVRHISNLIVDQTQNNPAAVAASLDNDGATIVTGPGIDGVFGTADDTEVFFLPNVTPDEGLSAPFNSWMTLFGQFFDHGLDLANKGGSGTVFIPLLPDDPLYQPGSPTNFMVLTRATHLPGADGQFGTNDDIFPTNDTSPFVDQNQTYSSHPSHQVFLRAYEFNAAGEPVSTGGLIVNRDLGADGTYGTADDVVLGGMATWGVVKAQASDILGIELDDLDALNLPLLATDQYGNFIPGSNGFPQLVTTAGLVEGNPAQPVDASTAIPTGHAFLADISHFANPVDEDGNPLTADADGTTGNPQGPGTYDDELLDAHYIAGDGRANENIGLTAVHHVFHSEHNRLVEHTKDVVLASQDLAFLNEWLSVDVAALPTNQAQIDALIWDGERLFQSAKFGTEMQYQHLVFEEFARKVQPNVDIFIAYDTTIDPSIVAEFAHTVYRFGHSMLTETVDRYDAEFNADHIGLIQAFLNPTEFAASGLTPDEAAGAIVRGMTRQVGNEIDEFVTEALRNNLLGLPLDLATINLARGRDTGVPTLNAARREFYDGTGDSQLKAYTSWVDFALNAKNPLSVVNFIAAYGTHADLLAADVNTAADKRAVATALVFGGTAIINEGEANERVYTAAGDRLAFLNSTGTYANQPNGVTTTGVDAIDLWIGGLAEKQMPFGGLLGSTFNFVFETQLEALQNGDRFYYLTRTAGLNFITQLEQNSFASLIMRNTDVTRLPGDVFSTPTFILEVDQTKQFNDGIGNADPLGDNPFIALVVRDNPQTPAVDTNYLHYTGEDHVVLGGTEGNDTMIAGIGDDTLWGDGGNDRLEGGDGADQILGGDGDDILTDLGGDDLIQGGNGNDVINGGNGINLLLGGFGKDFIMAGEDLSEIFGGDGDDFLYGSPTTEAVIGNEGSDWIETGTADGSPGDNFDPNALDLIDGHDVFIGSGGIDEFMGEGGDDIMVGGPGADRMEGMSGYDWVTYKNDTLGVTVDLTLEAFDETPIPPSNAAVMDRFGQLEGLSGSNFSDILLGDDADAAEIQAAGNRGSVLTSEGIARIDGLQDILGAGVTSFDGGNIILGGGGSDVIQGRGGNDIIDGDALLNVRISIRDGAGNEIGTADSMVGLVTSTVANSSLAGQQLSALMLSGAVNPSQLQIVREILITGSPTDVDTAVFSGPRANYQIGEPDAEGRRVIIDTVGTDGVDIIRNIERLQFADEVVDLVNTGNTPPEGQLAILGLPATEDAVLTATLGTATDADNPGGIITGPISYVWQMEEDAGTGVFVDIPRLNDIGEDVVASGPTFTPGDDEVGLLIRVKATYIDADGVIETVFSAPTDAVVNVNDVPTGAPIISDTTPTEGLALSVSTASIIDLDGIDAAAVFTFQWQVLIGTTWTDIAGETTGIFVPEQAQVGRPIRVAVTYTDDQGTTETVVSAATGIVGDEIIAGGAANTINGTAGDDFILAGGGGDTVNGLGGSDEIHGEGGTDILRGGEGNDLIFGEAGADQIFGDNGNDILDGGAAADVIDGGEGNDTITGGLGNDTLLGGNGNDIFNYTIGDGAGTLDGGAGTDTLRIIGTDGADTLNVVFNGTALSTVAGGTVTGVEAVTADLLGDTDTLSYGATGAAVTVNLTANSASGFTSVRGIENVTGGAVGDTLTGNALANVLDGGNGADTLDAGAGNDTLIGGNGNDTVRGGADDDTIIWSVGNGRDFVDGGAGIDTFQVNGNAQNEVFWIETVASYQLRTGLGPNQAGTEIVISRGTNLNNGVVAAELAGIDEITVNSGAGTDTFIVSGDFTGTDLDLNTITIEGSTGNDTVDVSGRTSAHRVLFKSNGGDDKFVGPMSSSDVVELLPDITIDETTVVNNGDGTCTVTSSGQKFTAATSSSIFQGYGEEPGPGENPDPGENPEPQPTILGTEGRDCLRGTDGDDFIVGLGGRDKLYGGDGKDTLDGGEGYNTLYGGKGDDLYIVNHYWDDIREDRRGGTDTVETSLSFYWLDHNVENLTYTGSGEFKGIGNKLDNVIEGGSGDDTLTGAGGNDTFVFKANFGNDKITDFDANPSGGQDRLDLSALGITYNDLDISAVSGGVQIAIETDTILLKGAKLSSVSSSDFIF